MMSQMSEHLWGFVDYCWERIKLNPVKFAVAVQSAIMFLGLIGVLNWDDKIKDAFYMLTLNVLGFLVDGAVTPNPRVEPKIQERAALATAIQTGTGSGLGPEGTDAGTGLNRQRYLTPETSDPSKTKET